MPTIRLTQAAVDKLKPPPEGRVEYWDTQLPGFGLRVAAPAREGARGRKSWQCLYRVNGKLVRETLGTIELIPKVDVARERARVSMLKAKAGVHPVEERRRIEEQEEKAAAHEAAHRRDTLAAVLNRYVKEYGAKRWRPGTLKEITRAFEYDVKPAMGARPVRDLMRREVRELLDGIVARGRAPYAHHLLAYLRPALGWAVEKEIIEANPAEGIPDPDPRRREARTRDRHLNDEEIRLFWAGCDWLGWPFGPMFKLLLLTAQRRDEVAGMTWDELDIGKRAWTIPRERAKNNRAHEVHLSDLAVEILGGLQKVGGSGYVFTVTATTPVSGFSRAHGRLTAAMLAAAGEKKIEPFTLHDLRRTAATGMAKLNIPPHVVDRILNHVSGTIRGVAAVYNRFEYLGERRAALEAWSRHVESLIRLVPSNVVPLASAL